MNIFKKIGIILSCSIIAFLGVFGVVASTSNINNQVRELPVVERHNLVGSDVVLNETNYMNYDIKPLETYNSSFGATISSNFVVSGLGYKIIVENDTPTGLELVNFNSYNFSTINFSDVVTLELDSEFNVIQIMNYLTFIDFTTTFNINCQYSETYFRIESFSNLSVEGRTLPTSEFLNLLNGEYTLYVPPVDQFLPTITTIVGDCVSWFVSIFTGLSDTFILTDSNGVITGLSSWGQVLFIGVAILLVSMALKWVISLVRGI